MTNRLKIGQEVLIHGHVDEIRKDTVIIRNEGGYFGTVECEVTDIEMPNTDELLDKIRAEIEKVFCISVITNRLRTPMEVKSEILQIIDKYKAESEVYTDSEIAKSFIDKDLLSRNDVSLADYIKENYIDKKSDGDECVDDALMPLIDEGYEPDIQINVGEG